MKRNLDTPILDLEGKDVRDGIRYKRNADGSFVYDPGTSEPIVLDQGYVFTAKHAAFAALNANIQGEQLSDDEKIKVYLLGVKCASGGEVDLSTDECALLKKRVGKVYGPLVYGRMCDFLDTDPAKE